MEKKTKQWQRRGIFALVSQRDRSGLPLGHAPGPEDEEDEGPIRDEDR